jgi:hypothetical protein
MKLKLDAEGKPVYKDELPIFIADNGDEIPFDAKRNMETIKRLNGENQQAREKAEAAETSLKAYGGLFPTAEAAKAAKETLEKIDQKKLVENGELEKVREEMKKAYEPQLAERDTKLADLQSKYDGQFVSNAFANSEWAKKEAQAHPDVLQALFSNRFVVKDGKVLGRAPDGGNLFSKANPGELATFDEALEAIVGSYPHKASILKSKQQGGSGAPAGSGGGGAGDGTGGKKITRTEFAQLGPAQRAEHFAKGGTVVDGVSP